MLCAGESRNANASQFDLQRACAWLHFAFDSSQLIGRDVHKGRNHVQPDRMTRLREPRLLSQRQYSIRNLRSAFFAQAGESAGRYGVRFERVLMHLWRRRQSNHRLLLRSVVYLDDLTHAVACLDGSGLAWADLADRYERSLIRRCRASLDEIGSTMIVRRLLADLRRVSILGVQLSHESSLAEYSGTRPLRRWLNDRLMAARSHVATHRQWMSTRGLAPVRGSVPALKNGTCDDVWPPAAVLAAFKFEPAHVATELNDIALPPLKFAVRQPESLRS